jgi:hypothetical protein
MANTTYPQELLILIDTVFNGLQLLEKYAKEDDKSFKYKAGMVAGVLEKAYLRAENYRAENPIKEQARDS